MILITIYNIVESLNSMNNKYIFSKIYIWYKRKKLIKMINKYINKLDKDFFTELIQFADLTNIFNIFSGDRITSIEINDDIKVFINYRSDNISVLYTKETKNSEDNSYSWLKPTSYSTRISKEFKGIISPETTEFPDDYVNDIIINIHDTLNKKLTNYILNKEEE